LEVVAILGWHSSQLPEKDLELLLILLLLAGITEVSTCH